MNVFSLGNNHKNQCIMNKCYLLIFIFFQLSFYIHGQTAQLQTDKKHRIEIQFSTNSGSIEIPDEYYEFNDSLFFVIKPKGDWVFKKGDIKNFKAIKIKQSEVNTFAGRVTAITNASKDIIKVIFAYPRANIDITKQFEFFYDDYVSPPIEIPENNWAYFSEFNNYYNSGKDLFDKKKYIEAFKKLKNILPGNDHYTSYSNFSSYNRAYDILLPDIVSSYQENYNLKLRGLQSDFNSNDKVSGEELAEMELLKDSVIIVNNIFGPYYEISEAKNIDLRQSHEKLINEYNELYSAAYDAWKKSCYKVIENGFYDDENKYEIYIELITRLLVYTNHIEKLSKYDSINISLISDPGNEISFFNSRIDILEQMNWKDEFITLLKLINEDIAANSQILGQTFLLNLKGIIRHESQPNYYIINAFNELVKGKFVDFKENIYLAIAKCTNKEILYYLELWHFSYRFKVNDVDQGLLDKINEGLEYEKKYLPIDAIKQYEMAKRVANSALPPFLIGRIKLENNNEVYSAERYIDNAINIYPGFALARIFNLEILIINKQYDNALNEIEAVLNIPNLSIWYIYYLKARLLFLTENYNGALDVVQNNCNDLSSNNFEQYILLGDIYLALKDCTSAKENYQSGGGIEPDNPKYREKMQKFFNECNN